MYMYLVPTLTTDNRTIFTYTAQGKGCGLRGFRGLGFKGLKSTNLNLAKLETLAADGMES